MKHYKRRETGSFPYYKLAAFDHTSFCFRDGKVAYPDEQSAKAAAKSNGRYRVSIVTESGRQDLDTFDVAR
jgi:hypothetical protein